MIFITRGEEHLHNVLSFFGKPFDDSFCVDFILFFCVNQFTVTVSCDLMFPVSLG